MEPPIISSSLIIDFVWAAINLTLPLQIDIWFRFDDNLKITSYDVVFRRWAKAYTYMIPKLLPVIATEVRETLDSNTNTTALITRFAAQQICAVEAQYCTGGNQQYERYMSNSCFTQ